MNLADKITHHIRTQLVAGGGSVGPDSNLAEDGHLDSTAMLELILWVADTFNISVQAEDFTPENFGTPRNIAEFVERRLITASGGCYGVAGAA